MRTLASIQRIISLQPIPNADAIEVATILGWHVVVKKGEFEIGELVVYCEIDSILPPRPEFEFLSKVNYRIKTVKLRGQISQGICFPVSILGIEYPSTHIIEGEDVTELLDIKKYELPVPAQLAGKVRGNFPGFLPKTDETRIQAYPDVLTRYQDIPFYMTEKLDGSSCTFFIKSDEFHVCSRNLDLLDDGKNTLWRLAKEMQIEEKMRKIMEEYNTKESLAIQGEVVGEGIQGNKLKIKGQKIYFFNAYDFILGRYYSYKEFKMLFTDYLKLETVPVIETNITLRPSVDQMVGYILDRRSVLNEETIPEGYVFRPLEEMKDPDLGRLSFKVINPDFLLKHNE